MTNELEEHCFCEYCYVVEEDGAWCWATREELVEWKFCPHCGAALGNNGTAWRTVVVPHNAVYLSLPVGGEPHMDTDGQPPWWLPAPYIPTRLWSEVVRGPMETRYLIIREPEVTDEATECSNSGTNPGGDPAGHSSPEGGAELC